MNPLTLIRDLVYQQRFTESLRLILSCREVGLPYIRTHSGKVNPNRRTTWVPHHTGSGKGLVCSSGDGTFYGERDSGNGKGNGWAYGYNWDTERGLGADYCSEKGYHRIFARFGAAL